MKTIATVFAAVTLFSFHFIQSTDKRIFAQTLDEYNIYMVKKGESLFDIATQLGVSEMEIQQMNFKKTSKIKVGEKLVVPEKMKQERSQEPPAKLSENEQDLLARLVHAEAKGEPYEGKIAVAEVVLNRVSDDRFPDSVKEVIYQDKQFQPVDNGSINKPADNESKKAVTEAVKQSGKEDDDSVFFYNPDIVSKTWLQTRTVTKEIGNHRFAK
ncbi:cell wall hydrolase [Cytobacillus horneckiae]|uniref:Peptidoglycan-binding protein n=1 Tax=Cytobacillus horneckiae TaxID=549687 RepID=A0A2N0Z8U1_9BACI|nr:cell wall hydrolase [Cytobacillus horneckiae]MBN6889275.1 cell wall hydrolase [Cytobacillus horneckiae]MCM3178495.1 cell wall hydrolase [Cytobacillus horneckiae]MEC1156766.1 cell wall hydrolase [Cytobacillus horneckiae]MED2940526.1 cell wall hydrolase [Cytobacillus horneckiae]PKG25928.1 peptidoglycan-binding protein [Cytobacillus horneckiae]